jgi:isoaspartyl peptidase/L-asparaginase-like protein (Ntn-hydrolase superfamily)
MERTGGAAGVIGLDRNGRFGWDHHGDQFAVAWANQAGPEPRTAISRKEKP